MPNTETAGQYRAEGRTVHKSPVGVPLPGGGKAISVGFPVFTISDWVTEPEKAAAALATEMNAFGPLREALDEARSFVVAWKAEYEPQARSFYGGHQLKVVNAMLSKIDAALKAARGEAL